MVRTLRLHCRGCGFHPWPGTKISNTEWAKKKKKIYIYMYIHTHILYREWINQVILYITNKVIYIYQIYMYFKYIYSISQDKQL